LVIPGGEWQYPTLAIQRHAIDPVGESKSDREVVYEIAKKLGKYHELTQDKTNEQMIRETYDGLGINHFMSWEEFSQKDILFIHCRRLGKRSSRTQEFL
jgi:trimethylamine-N-oxide reductase (cytochrome c)